MKGQMVFSYKNGQKVPGWVQFLSGGNVNSGDVYCTFNSNGKLYIIPGGDIVCYSSRCRDRNASVILLEGADGCNMSGAGDNSNVFRYCHHQGRASGATIARRNHGISITTRAIALPEIDPRL